MSKGYWIARVDVADVEKYKLYVAANAKPFAKFGAKFLVRSGRFEAPEPTHADEIARVNNFPRSHRALRVGVVATQCASMPSNTCSLRSK